jgi:hypothetical protein
MRWPGMDGKPRPDGMSDVSLEDWLPKSDKLKKMRLLSGI